MQKLKIKDFLRRKSVKRFELKKFVLSLIMLNKNFLSLHRWKAVKNTTFLPKNSSKTTISRRCTQTISKKAFSKFSKFSRVVFREMAKKGKISFLRKSSW